MQKKMSDYEKMLEQEMETRLSRLDQADYDWGKPFNKWDWFFVGAAIVSGFIIIICGML